VERTECLVIPRAELFRLLEQHPTLARGFVHGLTHRIVQLTKELRNR
jgi:CRP-like cAMP-binding protein